MKVTADSDGPKALGTGIFGSRVNVQNNNAAPGGAPVYLFTGGWDDAQTPAAKVSRVVGEGLRIAPGATASLENRDAGVDLSAYFVACENNQTADVRILP